MLGLKTVKPDKTVPANLNVGLENCLILPARNRRCAVGGDDQVVAGSIVIRIGDFRLEGQLYAEAGCAPLEDLQQSDAGDAAKSVAAGSDPAALEEDVNVVPVAKGPRDFGVGLLVHGPESVHGLVGEYNPPAESVCGQVAFDDRHIPRLFRLLEKDREIKTGRSPAKAYDSHWVPPDRPDLPTNTVAAGRA